MKVLFGAKRMRVEEGRMKGLVSESGGRLFQLVPVLYCQKPCVVEAALLTMAMPPSPGE